MKRIPSLGLLFLLTLSGFAQEAPKATATVYFYRLRDGYGAMFKPSVFCDKAAVLRMRNGRFNSEEIPAGNHVITSTFPGNGLSLVMDAGKTYYFRLDMTRATLMHSTRGQVTKIDADQGRFEVAQLTPSEKEDVEGK